MVQDCVAVARCGYSCNDNDFNIFWVGGVVLFCGGQWFERAGWLDFLKKYGQGVFVMDEKMQWFVVNVHTGCEDKVARNLREQIDKRRLNAYFGEILVPTREVTEIKAGKRVKSEKKFFPGYIVVQMVLNNETFSLVKLMPQVVMFLGAKNKPIAVSEEEARRLLKQVEEGSVVADDITYEVGQEVHVIDGPFSGFNGVIAEVDNLKQKMTVTILVFGRETSVELDFTQVERV